MFSEKREYHDETQEKKKGEKKGEKKIKIFLQHDILSKMSVFQIGSHMEGKDRREKRK